MKGFVTFLGIGLCSCWVVSACGDDGADESGGASRGGEGGAGESAAGQPGESGGSDVGAGAGADAGAGNDSRAGHGGAATPGGAGNTPPEGGAAGRGSEGGGNESGGTDDGGAGGSGSQDMGPNLVFATAQAWAPQSLGGLEGADAKCQTAAQAAGLPGQYVAWLSDSTHDAKARLAGARGWVRTDGKPFADTVADIISGKHYYTPSYNEHGARIDVLSPAVTTGTNANGTKAGPEDYCADYTGAGAGVARGNLNQYDGRWTASTLPGDIQPCGSAAHLYCFQVDHTTPVDAKFPPSRKVFVTKGAPRNDMGIANFDAQCATEASAATLSGSFKAFVSTTAQAASARFELGGLTFARVDGAPIVAAATDIATAQALLAPINLHADGSDIQPGNQIVFSGSSAPNKKGTNAETCDNWSQSVFDKSARTGQPTSMSAPWWVYQTDWHCNTWLRLYCFQE